MKEDTVILNDLVTSLADAWKTPPNPMTFDPTAPVEITPHQRSLAYVLEDRPAAEDPLGYDLWACLQYNGYVGLKAEEIASIELEITGENDSLPWHWIVKLHDGGYAYITGNCDYTGWDCQSGADVFRAPTMEDAIRQAGGVVGGVFRDMLAAGESTRENRVDW